jgi:hypothetical protein
MAVQSVRYGAMPEMTNTNHLNQSMAMQNIALVKALLLRIPRRYASAGTSRPPALLGIAHVGVFLVSKHPRQGQS